MRPREIWYDPSAVHRLRMPGETRAWVLDEASLTARLRALCGVDFGVRVLRQTWTPVLGGEAHILGMRRGEIALLREVHLLCGSRIWVFARTIIPRSSMRGRCRRLAKLGERPLGEVLFSDPSMRREQLQVAAISRSQGLYRSALRGIEPRPPAIWGRRSLFRVDGQPILVNEIFLPGIGPFPGEIQPKNGSWTPPRVRAGRFLARHNEAE